MIWKCTRKQAVCRWKHWSEFNSLGLHVWDGQLHVWEEAAITAASVSKRVSFDSLLPLPLPLPLPSLYLTAAYILINSPFPIVDRKYGSLSPSWDTICCVNMFVSTLKPFTMLTDSMSAEKTVSMCSLYSLSLHIKKECETSINCDLSVELKQTSENIRSTVWEYIRERYVVIMYIAQTCHDNMRYWILGYSSGILCFRYEGDTASNGRLMELLQLCSCLYPRLIVCDETQTQNSAIFQTIGMILFFMNSDPVLRKIHI